MKAILLTAGYGKRLGSITKKKPKCLVKVKNKPMLGRWLETLENAGIDSCLVNTHYLSEQVKDFCYKNKFKTKITLKHENELLGTAGTLMKNLEFYENSDGILLHTDNYCLENFSNFIKAHNNRPKECLMTMVVFETKNPEECGICKLNKKNILVDFFEKEKEPHGNLANGAIYILSEEFLKILNKNFKNSKNFTKDIVVNFKNKIFCYKTKDTFIDIGNINSLNQANS